MNIEATDPYYTYKIKALQSLYQVMDPELFVNIVDLGLIYDIGIHDEHMNLTITMTLSTPHCPLGEAIRSGVVNALSEPFPGYTIVVNIVWDPPWSMDLVSEEGRRQLYR